MRQLGPNSRDVLRRSVDCRRLHLGGKHSAPVKCIAHISINDLQSNPLDLLARTWAESSWTIASSKEPNALQNSFLVIESFEPHWLLRRSANNLFECLLKTPNRLCFLCVGLEPQSNDSLN